VYPMPTLFLTCRDCHREFPTPIGISEEAMTGFIISGLTHHCPFCKAESEYVTQDYHLPKVAAREPAESSKPLPIDMVAQESTFEKVEADRFVPTINVADVPPYSGRADEQPIPHGS
jgi:hypothetical protein